jgi:hypothetical protein
MIRFLIPILLVSTSTAQTEKAGKAEIGVRFLAQTAPNDLGQIELVNENKRSEPFDLPVNNLSLPQTPPARTFNVWAVDKKVSLAGITLPEEGTSFIVLLIPSAKGGYSPVVMNSGDPAFKPGDIYFHNSADKTVLGFVGTSKFTLAPSKGTILRPKGAKAEKYYDVGLGVREADGDRVLSTTRWPEDNHARFYVFFYLDPVTKRVAYRAVDEFITPS